MTQSTRTAPDVKTDLATQLDNMNPFFLDWDTPFAVPPFDQIRDEHFAPAIDQGMKGFQQEVDALLADTAPATFENTLLPLERLGQSLDKVLDVFGNLANTDTNDQLQALESEVYPKLTAMWNNITLNPQLFARIKLIYEACDTLDLNDEQRYLVERYYRDFVHQGAELSADKKETLKGISETLSKLKIEFSQRALSASKAFKLVLHKESDLAGLPKHVQAMGKTAANAQGDPEAWVFTLDRGSYDAFMKYSSRRDLREQLYTAYVSRNFGGEHDNCPALIQIARLHAEKAELLGYKNFAHYALTNRMAKTPKAVFDFLEKIWPLAIKRASEEQQDLQAALRDDAPQAGIEPWDWAYYTEQIRAERFDLDESEVKPYFELNQVKHGIFYVAKRLFGVEMTRRDDLPVYHEQVEAYEVSDAKGEHVGVIYFDFYARDSKRQGAWMSEFRGASGLDDVRPIVINASNIVTPAAGKPTLLNHQEVITLFHEFGHGLHGLLTQVTYPYFSGTSVLRDFVEFPSQIMERWAFEPEVLEHYAKHVQTGEVIPSELVDKINAAQTFNQGFCSVEYLMAALLDMHLHSLSHEQANALTDIAEFEQRIAEQYGLPKAIHPRYHLPHFTHIIGGYTAGYYVYRWAEILDADGFMAFKESGDLFNPELADKLKHYVYEMGGSAEPMELYVKFRGREPSIDAWMTLSGFQAGDA